MRKYIDDFFGTLSTRQQTRVGDILAEARISKSQIEPLLKVLLANKGFVPINLTPADAGTLVDAQDFFSNGSSMADGLAELFDVSNLVSLLIESHSATLTADIKAQEDELFALEKLVENYAFLLADNNSYDFTFLEPFNDESGRDQQSGLIPDRAGAFFFGQNSSIRSDEGMLTIPDFTKSHGLSVTLLKGNASAYALERSPLAEMLSSGARTGWKTQFIAGGPISSSIPEAEGVTGAQVMLEFTLSQPVPASQIRLRPFSEQQVQLLKLTLYANNDEHGTDIVVPSKLITLDRPTTVAFPLQTISRFRVVLNQPIYERRGTLIPPDEEAYAQALKEIKDTREIKNSSTMKYYLYGGRFPKAAHNPWGATHGTGNSIQTLYKGVDYTNLKLALASYERDNLFAKTGGLRGVFQSIFRLTAAEILSLSTRSLEQLSVIARRFNTSVVGINNPLTEILDGGPVNLEDLKREARVSGSYDYLYSMGLYNVAIGVDAPDYKAVFISRPMSTQGDPGAIRIKTSEVNYEDHSGKRSSPYMTSVEYSVSAKAKPILEEDWLPILPVGTSNVVGERFFVDDAGKGYFRFPATSFASVNLYQNGMEVNISTGNYLYSIGNTKILGLNIPSGSWNGVDSLTIDYTPFQNVSVVEFASFNAVVPPLTQAFDSEGVGEGFNTTSGRYELVLNNMPYVDMVEVATSQYDLSIGMFPYQPITVGLQSGLIPINLTNYSSGEQGQLPSADDAGYYFIHSGNVLRFNRQITEPLKVYYQYIENNLRFRVVLRVNCSTFVAPKVDYVQLKAKTRKSIDRL